MKKFFVAGLFFAAFIAAWKFSNYLEARFTERNTVAETRSRLEAEAKKASTVRIKTFSSKLAGIKGLEELEKLFEIDAKRLSKGEYQEFSPVLRAKLFEANFHRAELLLGRAGNLLRLDNNHPVGKEYLDRAKKIYEKMDKLIEQGIPERPGEKEANARLNYMKGVYFYRLLIFVKDPKAEAGRIEELAGLSAKHLSLVFASVPREINAEYALEILQKKTKEIGAAGGDSQARLKLELLPSGKSGSGPTFAIEGLEEGRH